MVEGVAGILTNLLDAGHDSAGSVVGSYGGWGCKLGGTLQHVQWIRIVGSVESGRKFGRYATGSIDCIG